MKTPAGKLWIVAILVALLPGLLIRGGELRVCLHALFGFSDGCAEMQSDAAERGCCSSRSAGPTVAGDHECEWCCFEVSACTAELALKSPVPDGQAAHLGPPSGLALRWMAPSPPRALAPQRAVLLVAPPGRAPSPLRI